MDARVVKLVDTADLKSAGLSGPCRFDSGPGHQPLLLERIESITLSDRAIGPSTNEFKASHVCHFHRRQPTQTSVAGRD